MDDARRRGPIARVGLFLKDGGDGFLLMRRRGSRGAGTWCLPGGHLEFGQAPEEAAAREALEELGVSVDPAAVRMAPLHTNDVFVDEGRHYVTLYGVARVPEGAAPRIMEPGKCDRIGMFRADALPEPLFLPFANLMAGGWRP